MRRFMTLAAFALAVSAVLSTAAQAQLVQVQVGPPVIYSQPVVPAYYYPAPTYVAPSVSYYSAPRVTYSYYPSAPSVVTYSAPPVVTYAAPVTYVAPAGYYETRTYYGYGIFRPRGYYSETYYRP